MSKNKKLSVSDLLFQACIYADQDREAFIDAHKYCDGEPAVEEAKEFLQQLREYRLKRWGLSELEEFIENCTLLTIPEILERHSHGKHRAP